MDLKNQTQKRTIKFRAWDESQNYMAYQGTPDLESMQSFMHHFGDKTLMQFTGLHDKNGKEIYEQMELNNIFIIKWLKFRYVLFYISNLTTFEEIFDYENKLEITGEYTEL